MRAAVKAGLAVLVLLSAAYFFVLPARTYLAQKTAIALERKTIEVLKTENAKLGAERSALNNNATVAQIAKQDYGLVAPGQQAFMVLPSSTPVASAAAPAAPAHHWYTRLEFWDDL
jgi:cell division protein FtsL